MAGLTTQGFIVATQEEIRVIIANALKANLGADIDTNPSSRIGQFIDIVSRELESLWLGLEDVYNSQFPYTASGISLDNIGSITNTPRNPGSSGSVFVFFGGAVGSVIPVGTTISTQNGVELTTDELRTIQNNHWLITLDLLPTSDKADFNLTYQGLATQFFEIYPQDPPDIIKSKIIAASILKSELISVINPATTATFTTRFAHGFQVGDSVNIDSSSVGGYWNGIHTITAVADNLHFSIASGTAIVQTPMTDDFATGTVPKLDATQIEVQGQFGISRGIHVSFKPTITTDLWGINLIQNDMYSGAIQTVMTVEPATDVATRATGVAVLNQSFPAGSISEIVSSVSNVNTVLNIADGVAAQQRETDAQYRTRLMGDLTITGAVSIKGIQKALLELPGVTFVGIIDNPLSTVDSAGRPGHSFEAYVEGGSDNEIAQKLYDLHPPGVAIVSTAASGTKRGGQAIDVNGQAVTIEFSQVQRTNVVVEVDIVKTSAFPSNGEDLVKDIVASTINALQIDQTFYSHTLYGPINTIPGITQLTVMAALAGPSPIPVVNAIIDPPPLHHVYIDKSVPGNIIVRVS
jgi:uncharacterized phage protein gp47/JayE